MTNLEQLEALAKAATPGPWRRDRDYGVVPDDTYFVPYEEADPVEVHSTDADATADYIVAVNPETILALIQELKAARQDQGAGQMTRKSGFYDAAEFEPPNRCQHPTHTIPEGIEVPHGKYYRHVCEECGAETLQFQTRMKIESKVTRLA